jgi:hypothetical protein
LRILDHKATRPKGVGLLCVAISHESQPAANDKQRGQRRCEAATAGFQDLDTVSESPEVVVHSASPSAA